MRSKYLGKLLELIAEMEGDRREMDSLEKSLLYILRAILTAFWFYQIDDLWQHIAGWKLTVTSYVNEDAEILVSGFLEEEVAASVAVEASEFMTTEEEAATDREETL